MSCPACNAKIPRHVRFKVVVGDLREYYVSCPKCPQEVRLYYSTVKVERMLRGIARAHHPAKRDKIRYDLAVEALRVGVISEPRVREAVG